MDKPKLGGIAALILSKAKPMGKPDEKPELGESSTSDMGFDSAIEDLFSAIESKDKEAFKSAFKSAVSLCPDDDGESDPEENKGFK